MEKNLHLAKPQATWTVVTQGLGLDTQRARSNIFQEVLGVFESNFTATKTISPPLCTPLENISGVAAYAELDVPKPIEILGHRAAHLTLSRIQPMNSRHTETI